MIFDRIDLGKIRSNAADLFLRWDAAVAAGRHAEALAIRRHELWPMVRTGMKLDTLTCPGIYAFLDDSGGGWGCVSYIGQSKGTLSKRLEDYVKDDSCWDPDLINNGDRVMEIGYARLRPVMPSADETLDRHLRKHIATIQKSRGSSLFVAGFEAADSEVIVPVEAALIAIAWSHGAPLRNEKLERLPTIQQRGRVLEICSEIVRGWGDHGLNRGLKRAALEAIDRAATIDL